MSRTHLKVRGLLLLLLLMTVVGWSYSRSSRPAQLWCECQKCFGDPDNPTGQYCDIDRSSKTQCVDPSEFLPCMIDSCSENCQPM